MLKNSIFGLMLCILICSCSTKTVNYNDLGSFDKDENLRAVIEIPSGTNDKIEYRPARNTFEIDSLNGKPRVVDFLPYPVNFGFVPLTKTSGLNIDPLDILVYAKPLKTGQIIAVRPIAILKMMKDGEVDDKILSIPVDAKYQIINIKGFQDLSQNHTKLRDMIAEWFSNYDRNADIDILGWFDEDKAIEEAKSLQYKKTESNGN
jgi:inorganic pyrophosphatase